MLIYEDGAIHEPRRGKLRVFFGFAAGVGKTYSMLTEAHELLEAGKNVVVGYVEPHDRPETNQLLEGLPAIPPLTIEYKHLLLKEPDIDQIIAARPEIVLIDELAHTNAAGSRHKKRYQDVDELLQAGIDVMTTLNVQHLESLNDVVEKVTGITVRETVPDTILQQATLKVVDVEPAELIHRLEQGKIYTDANTQRALRHFFMPEKLDQLRGLAIQRASDYINRISTKTVGIQNRLLTIVSDEFPKMREKCIRWSARLAQDMGAEWTVMQVRNLEDTDTELPLAEKLGAQVISIEETNAFETVIEFAKMTGITDIIIGKNRLAPWYERIFLDDYESRILRRLPGTEVHLVPFMEKRQGSWWKKRQRLDAESKDFWIVGGGVLLTTLLTGLLQQLGVDEQNLMMTYLFFILLVARATSGYLWSALASVLSVVFFNWFFVEPLHSLTIYQQGYILTLFIMLSVALMISNIMMRLKKQAERALAREHRLDMLYELNKRYIVAEDRQEVLDISTSYLSRLLNRDVVIYNAHVQVASFYSAGEANSPLLTREEAAVAAWVADNQRIAGYGADTLSGAKGFYLPIVGSGKTLAVLGMTRNHHLELENDQLNYLQLIVTQLAVILEQMQLKYDKKQVEIENEREKVRGNLLRLVSHDIRTPLTVISGTAETLSQEESMQSDTTKHLLQDIQDEAQWLIQLVKNLLSITRIDSTTQKVATQAEAVEEIVEAVYRHIKKAYPKADVTVDIPDEVLFVEADSILIEQALFNLIENAIRHGEAKAPVTLAVMKQGEEIVFTVTNAGEMPLAHYQRIQSNLDNTRSVPVDSKNGLGIGLSIVKTIVHAHNGRMEIQVADGQTRISLYLK
ncbi:MAG: DUF4118 domain-containing protein [Aerococcus sp.]|nr:DUF4118 domain-containing protein [Aerococcus sp.]